MATEAEIIPEPIAIGKTEEESRHLTKELCDKAVEFLPGDLKKFQAGFNQPAETDECLAKEESMQATSDPMNTVSEGNPEVPKGESFLISPETAKVASKETSGMSEHSEVDDIPFKAEKMPEDEKQRAGSGENEVKATEDIVEKYNTDHDILNLEGSSLKAEKLEELNLAIGGEKRAEEVVVIADQGSSLEEKCGSVEDKTSYSQERENEGTRPHENDDIESNKQVLSVPEANLELKKQASIDTPDPVIDSLKKVNETVTKASNSNLVQEELEEKSCKEVKDTEPEKLPALAKKEKGIEAIEPIETSGTENDQIISESIGGNLTSTVAESSGIKDHETTSEISEGVKKELPNTYEEVACEHKAAPEGDDKLEEVSGTIIKDQSQATIESSEEIKYITGDNDSTQDKNMLDTSSVMKPEELCLQDVDNRDICSIGSNIRTENIVEKSPTEESGQSDINEITDKDSATSIDISKDYSNSESEKVGADMKVVQATEKELAMTEASDEMKKDEECTVLAPEGNISVVENINAVQQSQEGKLEKEEIPKESFQKQNEPEKEKSACPLNAVYEDVNTVISSENAETSTSIKEVTSLKDHEERFEGDGMEDTPTNTDAISENGESKEKDHLQIEVNVNTESMEVEIPNKNADDLHVADPLVGESAEKEDNNQYEFSDIQPEEQVHEENGATEEKDKHIEDVSEACQSRESTNSENIFTEEATTADLESETSEMDKEKVKEVYLWDPEKCPETNEALENKQEGIQEEEEACNAEKPEIETRGDTAESGLTGGGASDTIITSSFVRDETTPELTGENKSYKEDADERSNTKEEDHDEPKIIKIGKDNDEQTVKDDPMLPSPKLIEEETIESSKDENKVEKLEEENSKDWITEDGKSKDLSPDSITEAPIQNLQDDEEREEEFEKSEKAVGESTGEETSQPAESPQEMLNISMMKQEEDLQCEIKNLNPKKTFPEEKRDEDRSYIIQAEESSRNIEQDEAKESNEKKPTIAEEDFEQISTENEPQEMLEQSLYITSEETETISSKADEIPSLMEEATVQNKEETTENEEKVKGETDDSSTNDNFFEKEDHGLDDGTSDACKNTGSIVLETEKNVDEMEVETITKEYELDSKEKPEPKDVVENIEDNLKQKETEEAFERPKSTIKEECAVIDDSPASTEEEMSKSFQKDEEEETPELEVCKESGTAASGTGRENSDTEEQRIADISNSSISDETVKESIKEDKSSPMKLTKEVSDSNIEETDSTEETTLQFLKETAEPINDPSLFDILKESKEEITPTEIKEDLVCSSSFEPEESKKDTEKETSVKGSIITVDLDSALPAAETEETDMKEAEAEEKKHEINNVLAVEKNSLATTEHEGVGIDSADIYVKPADSSISCEKDKEIPKEEEDKVPNEGSEDQMEMTAREIPSKEILDALKDHSTMPSEEHEPEPIEERKLTDETSEKDQAPYEHSETPASEATDEKLMQMENNPTLDVPKVESEDTGKESGHEVKENLADEPYVHTEQETGKCTTVSEAIDVSKGEEPREPEFQHDACESETSQNEQSSDFGLEREKTDDGKPLDEATNLEETSSSCKDGEKAIQEEENLAENLAKPESLKEDIEVEKEETELQQRSCDQMPEIVSMNDTAKNVELALAGSEEKPKSDSEPVAEDQSKETFPETSKSQADETTTNVQNQEAEKQIKEEEEDKLEDEDYINREQNANEVSKAVILSEEVDKEVEKAVDSEGSKEHVEEESSTNELHPVPKGDETTNEVEDYSSVSTECLKEADSAEQIEAKHSEVEAHSTKDREASLIIEESEERGQDEESRDPVSVHEEESESEEKIKEDVTDESKLCQDRSNREAVTEVRGETSLNKTEVDEELLSTVKEESAIIDDSPKSTEEEIYKSFQKDEKEETPEVEECEKLETNNTVEDAEKQILEEEDTNKDQPTQLTEMMEENAVAIMSIKEVCKQSETAASGTGREKSDIEEHPTADISNSSINDETVKESIREDESSPFKLTKEAGTLNIEETDSTEETTLQILKETAEPNNDPILFDILKESNEEITPTEIKEDLVCSSSFEPEESKKNTEEETSVKGSINTVDLDSALPAAETEETDMKEAEAEEKKQEIDNVLAVEKNGPETTEHEGVGTDSAGIDVKLADSSISCEKGKEIPQEEEDKVPNEGSEDQMEMTAREIPLKEILGDALKDYSTVPSEEHEPEPIEERKLTDETSEKDQAPYEHSEAPVSEAMDEKLMQMENNPTLDAPKVEFEDNGKGSGHEVKENLAEEPYVHTEEETGKCNTVSEATDVSKWEEPREPENQRDACEPKTPQDEQSSDFGLERKETDDGKPLDEATNLEETSGTCEDGKKAIQEEENLAENLAKSESLKEDIAVEKEETEPLRRAHDQMPEADSVNDNAKNVELALAGFEEKPKSDSEPVAEDQSKETFPESSESQADETTTDVQNPETEKQINEEVEDKLEHEEHINREENANEVSKTVILSEEVDKEVDKADDNKGIKEHVMEEESSTNELHPVPKGDETTNEVEDYSSVSTECLKQADSEEQIEAKQPEVEAHSTKDRETSLIIEESEEKGQDEESRDPVSVHGEERESEEGIEEDIADESKLCQNENDSEAVTKVRGETSLNNTEVDEELVNTSNASSGKMSLQTTLSDANQETKEVENVQLEEISSGLAPQIPSNDNDEVQKQGINVDIVDKDDTEVNERDSDAVHMSKDQIDEAEKSLTVEKVDQLPSSDNELVETKSETSKTSTAGEPGNTEEDAENKKSLTAEEQDGHEVEETKGVPETSSDCISQRVETIVEDDISSHNTLPKEKPEEQLQTSVSTLPSEDKENSTAHPIEKIGEQIQTDAEIVKRETLEDSSDTKTTEELCLQKEEKREPTAVSEEETIVDRGLQKEEPKGQIQTTSSTLPSEESRHGTGATSEEIECDKAKEEVPVELDVFSGDESEQNLSANKLDEGATSSELLPKEQEEEAISTVEKIEEEKIKEAEIPENKISEDSSDAKKTIETCLEKEEFQELEDAKKDDSTAHPIEKIGEQIQTDAKIVKHETLEDSSDTKTTEEVCLQKEEQREPSAVSEEETIVDRGLQKEEPKEQIQTTSSTLPSEESRHGTGATSEEIECDKAKEEVPVELDVFSGDESEQNLSANKLDEGATSSELLPKEQEEEAISTVEKIEEEKIKEAEIPENKISEDSSDAKKTIETCLEKEEFQELEDAKKDDSTAHPIEKIEEEIQKDAKIVKHETLEDSSDTKTTEEVCLQKEEQREPSAVSEEETIVDRGLQKEEPKEQIQTTSSTLPSEESRHGTGATSEEIECDKAKEEVPVELDVFSGDESEQNLSANKLDEGATSSELLPKEQEEEAISTVEKIEEEKIKEAEIPENKISEDSSDATKTIETCLEKEEFQELEDAKKDDSTAHPIEKIEEEIQKDAKIVKHETLEDSSDTKTTEEVCLQKEEQREPSAVSEEETIVDRGLQKEEPKEQIQTTSSTLPSEESRHGTGATSEEIECDKAKEEVPVELDVFSGDESEQNLSANKLEEGATSSELLPKEQEEEAISTVEKIEEEKIKEAEIPENKISEDSSDAKKTIETCLEKEEFQELEDAKKDGSTAHPIEKIEEETQKDAEIVKHETLEDSSDTKTTEEVCLQKEEKREPSAVLEEETIVDQGLQKEEPEEQIQNKSSTLPFEEREHGTGATSEEIECDKAKEEVPVELDVFSGDKSEQNLSANKLEEGATSSELLPKEQEEEAISTVEKIEEEKIKEAEIPENKISEDSSDAKKTIETCLEKEEFQELEDAKKDDSTAHPIEKIEEETQKDAEIVKHETLEDSSDTKTTEEVCLQKEEKREPSAVLEEETIVDQGLQKEEPEEQIQNKSSTLPSEEREHGTGAISEEIEYDKTREEVCTELDVFSGDKSEQNLSANKSEEGNTRSELLPKEQKEEVISTVEKMEDKKIKEAEIPENKILEDSSEAKKTIEMCLEKEEFQEFEDAKKDETAAAQALQVEEPKEKSLTSSSTLPSEDLEHGNTTRVDEIEEEKVKEVATLEKERPQEPEAALDQEITVAQVSMTEESLEIETMGTIQNLDEEKSKEAEKLNENSGDSSAVETEEICLQKEKPSDLQVFPKEEITSGQTFSEEQSDEQLHISTSAITSEELEHETKKAEDEITNEEEIIKDESPEYASDARTMEEVCSQKESSIELEAVVEDEKTADHTLTEKILEEQVQNPTSALPSKEEECGSASTTEKIGSEKTDEAEFLQDDNGEHECLRKEQPQEDEDVAKDDSASAHAIPTEKSEEQISGPFVALPSKEHKHETVNEVDKPEEEKVKEEEMQNEDSDEAMTVQEICSKKDETRDPRAVLEGETIATQVIAEESQEHGTLREEQKIKEAETLEDDKSPISECARELQSALEDEDTATQTLPEEKQADELHITTSTLPSEEQQEETREPELQEDESPEKTLEQTREIEEASNVKMETHEKAYDNELLTETESAAIEEKLVKARDETRDEENQCEKTNEGNEIMLNEVSKEEIIEDKEVIETSHSTSLSEGLTKDGCGVDELKDEPVEDKTNEAFKTTTCQNEELVVDAQKSSENGIIEKQTVCEDKTVEDPGQASVARIETATVMEEESSIELAQAEGTKDLAEGNEIIDDIQQPEETANIASDKQIPRVFYPIEITEITGSIGKEDVPIDLQDRVTASSQKAEVGDAKEIYPKVEEVEHGGDKTTDNLGEEITKDSMSMEDLTKVSTSDLVESSTKKTLQVTAQDMIGEREEKDETGATQILVDKPEKESPAPSSKFPCEEEEHAVKEEELKEVETPDNDSSDTNTGGEICFEKEEIKELRAVMKQETVAVQASPTELKDKELAETPVSKLEDVHKEDELKEEDIRDKTKETLKAPAYTIQNEELSVETKTDSAINNFEKEIVAEDKTVKDLEQASVRMEEATTAWEEIRGEADPVESTRTTSSIGKDHFPIEQQDRAIETSEKAEVGDLETGNAQEICSEAGVDHDAEKKTDNSGVGITQEPASPDSPKLSLSDLLQTSTREKMQVAKDVIQKRELIVSKEEPKEEEAEAIQLKEAKTDEGEEGDEHNKADSGSDAPVMVEAPRDTEIKPHKKSHSILSGVGSKVKHSISKVKKAITGKSSHSKDPKPISPKGSKK